MDATFAMAISVLRLTQKWSPETSWPQGCFTLDRGDGHFYARCAI